jgi:hypothetical protein
VPPIIISGGFPDVKLTEICPRGLRTAISLLTTRQEKSLDTKVLMSSGGLSGLDGFITSDKQLVGSGPAERTERINSRFSKRVLTHEQFEKGHAGWAVVHFLKLLLS